MPCDSFREKLDAYVDGDLSSAEAASLLEHLRECAHCAAQALERVQLKRIVASAGKRYGASARFREKLRRSISPPRREGSWIWRIVILPATLVLVVSLAVGIYVDGERTQRQRVYSELADLHVATLASASPVDVTSSDRHTVKPWFAGKIPFSFNLPELQGTEFTLVGGRVTYLAQTPGVQLIYQLRKHEISVFIFQDRGTETRSLPSGPARALSFNIDNWTQDGLRYFVLGDVSAVDIQALSKLLQDAR